LIVIPAIDIHDGRCVQLQQGAKGSASVYGDDPVAMAGRWTRQGARRIHVVDLDGAFEGKPVNMGIVEEIVRAAGDVPVQVGGGVRSVETIRRYLDAGVDQVIVGTRAVEDPPFLVEVAKYFPEQVILGLDSRSGRAATSGWDETSDTVAVDFARNVSELPLFAIVFTDIARDGMLTGVNVNATVKVAQVTGVPVIASGGVRDLEDIRKLHALAFAERELLGVITGSAIYEGMLDLARAQAILDAPH
jgi:phosphoribosylformimino-5-aminoimidazole carboxamide ribotide isomerase